MFVTSTMLSGNNMGEIPSVGKHSKLILNFVQSYNWRDFDPEQLINNSLIHELACEINFCQIYHRQ